MSPNDEQPLLSSLDAPGPRKRGRKPGQKSTKASELSDQELVQKVIRLSKRAGRSPEELAALLNTYLEKYQQIEDLRRKADEMERQLMVEGVVNGAQGPDSSDDEDESDESDHEA